MKTLITKIFFSFLTLLVFSCKKEPQHTLEKPKYSNTIQYAKGLAIYPQEGYTIIKITNPWPNASKSYTYILQKENTTIPDSLQKYNIVKVPIQSVVATSTTHIPSLEMLGVENTLVGFPNLNYISSEKVRKNIALGKVQELGSNASLNLEKIIDLAPSVIIGYGLDNNNPSIDKLEKSGLQVILNGDWNEQTPLGKAEWIKLFGALYGKEKEADKIFSQLSSEYQQMVKLAQKSSKKPTVMVGAMFEQTWYVPQGGSWGALFLKDAGANYLWKDSEGTGGLPLSFEKVFEKAENADFWIGPGQFSTLAEMQKANPHYKQFKAFQTKNVYSYSLKKGKTGGLIYFEEAPNRPDLVLKDLVKIIHPELLPNYQLYFFQKLQ